jgi:hypothetical protein
MGVAPAPALATKNDLYFLKAVLPAGQRPDARRLDGDLGEVVAHN